MALFASDRERRLWLWTLAVVVAIYSSLGIAAAYVLAFVRMSIPEERTHLVEYGVVGVFLYQALAERASRSPSDEARTR